VKFVLHRAFQKSDGLGGTKVKRLGLHDGASQIVREFFEPYVTQAAHSFAAVSTNAMRFSRKHKKLGKVVVTVEVTGH
jgi:hypothetical protein